MVRIKTAAAQLRLSPDHYLPICSKGAALCTRWADFSSVPAFAVRVGDSVLLHQGEFAVCALCCMLYRRARLSLHPCG